MANAKYDNLTTLMTSGWFDWTADPIIALLFVGATFDTTDVTASDIGLPFQQAPVGGRSLAADGSFLGQPVSFNAVDAGVDLQVVLARDEGGGRQSLLAWFDEDDAGDPFNLVNHGTFILRPPVAADPNPTQSCIWVQF